MFMTAWEAILPIMTTASDFRAQYISLAVFNQTCRSRMHCFPAVDGIGILFLTDKLNIHHLLIRHLPPRSLQNFPFRDRVTFASESEVYWLYVFHIAASAIASTNYCTGLTNSSSYPILAHTKGFTSRLMAGSFMTIA